MQKPGKDVPGSTIYSPRKVVHGYSGGRTFGLPDHLRPTSVPSAHDISYMVKHLDGLPGPDAYSPREPMHAKDCNRPFIPSKARTTLEQVMLDATQVPGPGT